MDLCVTLGYARPADLLGELSAQELNLWLRYASQRGLPHRNAEIQSAQNMLMHCATPDGQEKPTIETFLPYRKNEPPPEEKPSGLKQAFRAIQSIFGAKNGKRSDSDS